MKICHVIKATGVSGAERHLLLLLPALEKLGYQPELVVLADRRYPIGDYLAQFHAAGITAHQLPIRADLDLLALGALRAHFRQTGPDVVHTHLIHADLHAGWAARLAGRLPVVSSRHNEDAFRRRGLMRWPLRLVNQLATQFIAISESVRRFTIDVEQVAAGQITTIHYGYPQGATPAPSQLRQELGLADDQPLVLAVGRYVRQKGPDVLLDAWPDVLAAHPDARLVLLGEGPQRDALTAQIARLGVADSVHLTGWRDDAVACMASCTVMVLPSRWEGFGLVLLEAMSAACPVVASRVSAIPEIVADGVTGRLVAPESPAALAGAIIEVLNQPAVARQWGLAGRARLGERFSVARMAERHADVYEQLAG